MTSTQSQAREAAGGNVPAPRTWTLKPGRYADICRDIESAMARAPEGWTISMEPPEDKASVRQKRKMNAMCGDIAKQVPYHGMTLALDDWRHIIAASLFKLRIVPGLDNDGFVTLVPTTTEMKSAQVNAMIERCFAIGEEVGVRWSDPSLRQDDGRGVVFREPKE